MGNIGPSFGEEIAAAGLAGFPFSWGGDGTFEFAPAMTQAQRDAVRAVYAAPDPTREGTRQRDERTAKDRLLALAARLEDGSATAAETKEALAKLIWRMVR